MDVYCDIITSEEVLEIHSNYTLHNYLTGGFIKDSIRDFCMFGSD